MQVGLAQSIAVPAMGAIVFDGRLRLREMRLSPFFCVGRLLIDLIQNMKTETILPFPHGKQKCYLVLRSGLDARKKQMSSDCDTRTRALLESTGFYAGLKDINLGNSNLAISFEDPTRDHATKHRSINRSPR